MNKDFYVYVFYLDPRKPDRRESAKSIGVQKELGRRSRWKKVLQMKNNNNQRMGMHCICRTSWI